jgi:allophanate hydrolase
MPMNRPFRTLSDAHSAVENAYATLAEPAAENVFISVLPREEVDKSVDDAFREHPAGALTGMIVAVKDNIDVFGLSTTAACPGFSYEPEQDAECVAKLRRAGAVVIGKTNLDQFATGLVGTRSPYGVVHDATVPERISGGSSSGSAVAVALGIVDAALGTDTAGSGRVPAGLQGIVGVKPTLGAVSTVGVVPACESYDSVSVFARDLGVADTVMRALAASGHRPWPKDVHLGAPETPVIGVPAELPGLSASWKEAFSASIETLKAAGCEVKTVDLTPALDAARMLYDSALVAERAEAVGSFVAAAGDDDGLDPVVEGIVNGASAWGAVDVLRSQRIVAEKQKAALQEWEGVDAVVVPTAPFHPTIAAVQDAPVEVNSAMGTYTNFCNLFDLCALAVPAGVVGDSGRPEDGETSRLPANFGVTVLGRAFDDGVVSQIAAMIDAGANAVSRNRGTWVTNCVDESGAVPLAVFGAHLSGQPLNFQLRDRGAVFRGEVETTGNYRLYALNTTPPKPGLSGPTESGGRIVGEEWLISPVELAGFLSSLPAPMTLGAVTLSDGRTVTGFSCQPSAVESAEEITECGGWRAAQPRIPSHSPM